MARRISARRVVEEARTTMRAREGSLRVFPIETSSRSNVPPIIRIVSNTLARISESMMCPLRTTVSWAAAIGEAPLSYNFITRTDVPVSAQFGYFHHLSQDARGVSAGRKRKRQGEN